MQFESGLRIILVGGSGSSLLTLRLDWRIHLETSISVPHWVLVSFHLVSSIVLLITWFPASFIVKTLSKVVTRSFLTCAIGHTDQRYSMEGNFTGCIRKPRALGDTSGITREFQI